MLLAASSSSVTRGGRSADQEKKEEEKKSGVDYGTMTFPFPFEKPYSVQLDLMRRIYCTIDKGSIGVFESPTGTGKSLSVICSTLQWVWDKEKCDIQCKSDSLTSAEDNVALPKLGGGLPSRAVPDWIASFASERSQKESRSASLLTLKCRERLQARLGSIRDNWDNRMSLLKARQRSLTSRRPVVTTSADPNALSSSTISDTFEQYELEDYESDLEKIAGDSDSEDESGYKAGVVDEQEDWSQLHVSQVLYASRTHSQTSQFVNEIKRTAFAKGIRCVTLGSRRQLCINPAVMKLKGSDSFVNDACLDLQKGKGKPIKATKEAAGGKRQKLGATKGKGCPFLSSASQTIYRDHSLAKIQDIEELAQLGKDLNACPYYGTRKAVELAHLVVMPYAVLLQEESRSAMGIKLKGRVLVIDEAHNLVEAVNASRSVSLSRSTVSLSLEQLSSYDARYRARLNPKNLFYVNALLRLLRSLLKMLESEAYTEPASLVEAEVLGINDFLFRAGIDNVNIFKVLRYMDRSQISRKVMGFLEVVAAKEESADGQSATSAEVTPSTYISKNFSALQSVQSFLFSLTSDSRDGRIILTSVEADLLRGNGTPGSASAGRTIKFVMLNAGAAFAEIAREARSVVLLGGTMHPAGSLIRQLFPDEALSQRVETFSCGHVIPATNLLALCVGKGPSGVSFNFTYKQRSTHGQMDELGRLLTNVVRQVPGGAICFVSSYGYLDELVERFRSTGALAQLERHKAVFTEPKAAKDVEGVLARYSEATCKSGALLFCVVGAKMSEGINFSDELARCIVMVGLPYPPKTDPELKERLKYLDSLDPSGGGRASREYYQSICMRAVNQSIGRSIRHANDYAAILLVDARYHQQAVINLLPQWIGQLAARTTAFGEVVSSINGFFLSCNKTRGERTSAEASAEATM